MNEISDWRTSVEHLNRRYCSRNIKKNNNKNTMFHLTSQGMGGGRHSATLGSQLLASYHISWSPDPVLISASFTRSEFIITEWSYFVPFWHCLVLLPSNLCNARYHTVSAGHYVMYSYLIPTEIKHDGTVCVSCKVCLRALPALTIQERCLRLSLWNTASEDRWSQWQDMAWVPEITKFVWRGNGAGVDFLFTLHDNDNLF